MSVFRLPVFASVLIRECSDEVDEDYAIRREIVLYHATCVGLLHQTCSDQSSRMFAECFLIALKLMKYFVKDDVRPARDKK